MLGAFLVSTPLRAADDYKLGPDSQPQAGVPKGKVIEPDALEEQGLPRHRARLLGLRAGPVRRQQAGRA